MVQAESITLLPAKERVTQVLRNSRYLIPFTYSLVGSKPGKLRILAKGKPVVRSGRKATGLFEVREVSRATWEAV